MDKVFQVLLIKIILLVGFSSAQAASLKCPFIHPVINTMLRQHIVYNKYSSNLESRSIDQYIKHLDSSKLYLLKSDIPVIKKTLKGLFSKLDKRGGNCDAIHAVHKIYVKRVEERSKFAEKFLGDNYKFDDKVSILLDSDSREFPRNTKEANKFQSNYIHFQIANFKASEMKLKEAKDLVIKRYKRALKRLAEQDQEDIYSDYLDAFAHSLDPHSSFLSKEKLEEFQIQMRLSLEGIGATLSSQDGYTVIEQLIKGGAAEGSGLLESQDKIIAVGQGAKGDFEPIIDMPLNEVVRMIRGKKGTKVRLKILRRKAGETERFEVTLIRKKINLEEEAANIRYVKREVDGKKRTIGVIEFPSFYLDPREGGRSCSRDIKKLLVEANKKKVDGIVLDMSTNGGGSLDEAVNVAGLFFKTGNVVKTRGGRFSEALADKDPDVNYTGPLVVLTSRFSASASEIVAGALQDYKRAVIVGADHTFGKGSVQTVRDLPPGLGAFKVTIGMFFVPGGKSTQHRGVEADVVLPSPYSLDDIGEKSLDYSLPPKEIGSFLSSDAYVKSGKDFWRQLDKKTLSKLQKGSKARVAKNKEFKKIVEDLKKAKKKDKRIHVSEVLKEKDEKVAKEAETKKKRKDPNFREKEYMKRADLQEAINVTADLVQYYDVKQVVAGSNKSDDT